jgi:hypothetical protein
MNDLKLLKYFLVLLVLPLGLAMCSEDKFRYPCQDPANWDKDICKKPLCDVTRTCPEHVFKGGRDPRLGMPDDQKPVSTNTPATNTGSVSQGVNCGK